MNIIHLFQGTPFFDLPKQPIGWVGVLMLLAIVTWGIIKWNKPITLNKRSQWLLLGLLVILTPITSLFLGIQVTDFGASPLPYIPDETTSPIILLGIAVPWMVAAGFLGVMPAVLLGLLSGLVLGAWGTHSIFTPLEIAILALVFANFIRQSYRSRFYKILRHPIGAAIGVGVINLIFRIIVSFFETNGSTAVRLDYAITESWPHAVTRLVELVIGGGIAEIFYGLRASNWYHPKLLIPSPTEKSLQKRYYSTIVILVILLALVLTIGDWFTAGQAAKNMVRDRLEISTNVAAQTLPYFFETGQSLLQNIASPDLMQIGADQAYIELADALRTAPFYRQLYLFDNLGNPVTGYPVSSYDQIRPKEDSERNAVILALDGISSQGVPLSPWPGELTAQISFVVPVLSGEAVVGVLIGRTDIDTNPFTQQAVQALNTAIKDGGDGLILDEQNRLLYHTLPSPEGIMSKYDGEIAADARFTSEVSPTGTRQYVYSRQAVGKPWSIVLRVPAQQAQQLALNIAIPMLGILLLAVILGLLALNISLRKVTSSLQKLAEQTTEMAKGKLDTEVVISGEDEVGQLGTAFEKMRVSLRARLDELNRLLRVSQGVSENLDIKNAILPVLEAALNDESNSVRVVLIPDVTTDARGDEWVAFGVGKDTEKYKHLDGQLFDILRNQEALVIPNTSRMRRIQMAAGKPQPGAVLSFPIYRENTYYGTFWLSYESQHNFTEDEVRFYTTLVGEISMAVANSRLYVTSEVGRQRLEAVLSSTPDPVLVFDNQNCLFLLNPAALQVPGLVNSSINGKSIGEVVNHTELLELLNAPIEGGMHTREISFNAGRIFYASVAPVNTQSADGINQYFGKICLLRDITHFKELDTLKSDFVATVSHDLRSPLTLMRGYATMLQMVGELNEQQKGYVTKMVTGVDNMSRLVNNLLDLGRIDAGIDLKVEKTKPDQIVEQVVSSLQLQAAQKNIQLQVESALRKNIIIEADPALLHQAFYNLIENAIKYTPVNGNVKIRLTEKMDRVLFEVQDDGIGVAPIDLPRVFEKFYRSGRREAYQQRGTGLGLAIVKSVAERHGGKVRVESQLGKGSTFLMELPIKQTDATKSVS